MTRYLYLMKHGNCHAQKQKLVQLNKTHQASVGHPSTVQKYVQAQLDQSHTLQHRLYAKCCLCHTNISYACVSMRGCLLYVSAVKSIASHQLCKHRHPSECEGCLHCCDHHQSNTNQQATFLCTNHTDDLCCSVILVT